MHNQTRDIDIIIYLLRICISLKFFFKSNGSPLFDGGGSEILMQSLEISVNSLGSLQAAGLRMRST